MGAIELISAVLLILSCIFIIVIVFFQGGNKGGMSGTITGQSSDNYYERNMGRSKEMKLKKMTVGAAVLFFVVAIAVNVIAVHFQEDNNTTPESDVIIDDNDYMADDEDIAVQDNEDMIIDDDDDYVAFAGDEDLAEDE